MAFIPSAQRNRAADAVCARANGGTLVAYAGTVPADADAALSGNTVLATLAMGATAFGAAVAGVATANAITQATAVASGTATFWRVLESGGGVVLQGTMGTSGAEWNISPNNSIVAGGTVSCTALTYTQVKQT